jgi:hypothetical protein
VEVYLHSQYAFVAWFLIKQECAFMAWCLIRYVDKFTVTLHLPLQNLQTNASECFKIGYD